MLIRKTVYRKGVFRLVDYNEQSTEELLDTLITLCKVHKGLYSFELKGYEERLGQIKEVILNRATSQLSK